MNKYVSPELESRLRDLLAAPDADPAFVSGLRSKLMERTEVKSFRRSSPRLAWGIAITLVLLIIGLLVFSPQVVEAMRRLLGYIPGVGYVEKGITLRVLSAPVTVQKDGLTVTIQNGAADPQRTVLLAKIEGYTMRGAAAQTCTDMPRLLSADGSVQKATSAAETPDQQNDGVIYARFELQPMPAKVLDATLEIPCLLFDTSYRNWSIPLHFQVAQGTDQVIPVIELPTSAPTQPAPTGAATLRRGICAGRFYGHPEKRGRAE